MLRRRQATSLSFEQFVGEHAVAPAAVVVQQGQRTDGLVEDIQVAGVQQQTLSSDQGLAGHLEGGRLGCIAGVSGTGVLTQSHQHFVLDDVACGCAAQGLISGALAGLLGAGLAPEAVTIQLHGLTGLLGEIVDHNGLHCHLNDVGRVGPIKFCTKKLRKVIVNPHGITTP